MPFLLTTQFLSQEFGPLEQFGDSGEEFCGVMVQGFLFWKVFENPLKLISERFQFGLDYIPDRSGVQGVLAMHQNMPETNDVRVVRNLLGNIGTYIIQLHQGLADDL